MKIYVAASDEVLNENPSQSLYISYAFFERDNESVRVIWVYHCATLPKLLPTTWEETSRKIPNPEPISFNGNNGILIFRPDEKCWQRL